jgi:hypothetical protein
VFVNRGAFTIRGKGLYGCYHDFAIECGAFAAKIEDLNSNIRDDY